MDAVGISSEQTEQLNQLERALQAKLLRLPARDDFGKLGPIRARFRIEVSECIAAIAGIESALERREMPEDLLGTIRAVLKP